MEILEESALSYVKVNELLRVSCADGRSPGITNNLQPTVEGLRCE